MKQAIQSLLFTCLLVSGAALGCVTVAPEAQGWEDRATRLSSVLPLRIEATIQYREVTRRLYILQNGWGTVACLDSWEECAPLSSLDGPLATLPDVSLLHGWLTATSPGLVFGSARPLPGAGYAWSVPNAGDLQGDWPVQFKDWSYNPEVGYPLPGRVEVPARGRRDAFVLTLTRFSAGPPSSACCR